MNEQALQPNEKLRTITDLLEMRKGEIAKAAPRILDTKRLMRICLSSIQKNPLLLECSPASLVRCVMDAATFGLIPDGATNEAHLIPFYSGKKKCYEAQFMPGYSGIIKLALQSGYIDGVELHEVWALAASMIEAQQGVAGEVVKESLVLSNFGPGYYDSASRTLRFDMMVDGFIAASISEDQVKHARHAMDEIVRSNAGKREIIEFLDIGLGEHGTRS